MESARGMLLMGWRWLPLGPGNALAGLELVRQHSLSRVDIDPNPSQQPPFQPQMQQLSGTQHSAAEAAAQCSSHSGTASRRTHDELNKVTVAEAHIS